MVSYELHYEVCDRESFQRLFGESPPREFIGGESFERGKFMFDEKGAFYYDFLERKPSNEKKQGIRTLTSLSNSYGDQYIIPGELGFQLFVVESHRRSGRSYSEEVTALRGMIKKDFLREINESFEERRTGDDLQNVYFDDVKSIFHGNRTSQGKSARRIRLLMEHYPEIQDLNRLTIPGPCGTNIHILSTPEDHDLFDGQVRRTVESRIGVIETLAKERAEFLTELKEHGLTTTHIQDFFDNGELQYSLNIGVEEARRLDRLERWLGEGEIPLIT
jgi:hypothetical protein